MRYIIATIKTWNINNVSVIKRKYPEHDFQLIEKKEDLTFGFLSEFKPAFVFFPHWSWIIPEEIYSNFRCVVFHMTDLPFGRGGSPLQNLISRGIYQTKISAIKAGKEIDSGDVYLKEPFDISYGNVNEILERASNIIFDKMIPCFFDENISAVPQSGVPVIFKRRTPKQSEMPSNLTLREMYDYIRMLDGEGYPTAFIRNEYGKIFFKNAKLQGNKLTAEIEFWS